MYVLLLITATTIGTVTVQQLGTFRDLHPAKLRPRNNSQLRVCWKGRRCIFAASVSGIADGNASGPRGKRSHEAVWPLFQ